MIGLISKARARRVIIEDVSRMGEVFVSEHILKIAFAEMTPYNQGVTIFAFTRAGNTMPPLTFDEQVEQFCQANDLTFEMIVSERQGRFRKEDHDSST